MSRVQLTALGVAGALLMAASAPATRAPTQWAVVIGIDDYTNFGDEEGGDLRGAEADALRVRAALREYAGIEEDHILTLLGADATRDAIRLAMTEWLRERSGPEDRVVIYYSGHGTQILDDDGDEDDGLDEAICPVDVLSDSPERDIRDDDLREWLRAFDSRRTVVIFDSCHSGTATRAGLGYSRTRRLARVSDPPPVLDVDGVDLDAVEGIVELAAAAPGQSALEVEMAPVDGLATRYGGVFSTRLVERLAALPGDATFDDLYWATVHSIKAEGFEQDPQLSGPAAATPLSLSLGISPRRDRIGTTRFVVTGQDARGVILASEGIDAVPGLVLRSDAGALSFIDRGVGGEGHAVALGGGAVEGDDLEPVGVRLSVPEVAVQVHPDVPRGGSLAVLSRIPGVRLARSEADAGFELRPDESGRHFLVVGRDGSPRLEVAADGSVQATRALTRFFRQQVNALTLTTLDNPAEPFRVALAPVSGPPTFALETVVEVEVESDRSGFLTLIDFGADGEMTVLYPNRDSGPLEIAAGGRIRLPTPESGLVIRARPPLGQGSVVALVTPRPLEFVYDADGFAEAPRPDELFTRVARAAATSADAVRIEDGWVTTSLLDWNAAQLIYEIVERSSDRRES